MGFSRSQLYFSLKWQISLEESMLAVTSKWLLHPTKPHCSRRTPVLKARSSPWDLQGICKVPVCANKWHLGMPSVLILAGKHPEVHILRPGVRKRSAGSTVCIMYILMPVLQACCPCNASVTELNKYLILGLPSRCHCKIFCRSSA